MTPARLFRWLSGVGFAVAGAVFALLPLVVAQVSEPGDTIRWDWTGRALVLGDPARLYVEATSWDQHLGQYVHTDVTATYQGLLSTTPLLPDPVLMVAFVLILAGFFGAIVLAVEARLLVLAVSGIGGAVALVVGELRAINQLHPKLADTGAPITAAYGFWIVGGLLLALGVVATVFAARTGQRATGTVDRPSRVGSTT